MIRDDRFFSVARLFRFSAPRERGAVPPSLQNFRRFLASFKMVSWRTSYHCMLICSTTYDHLLACQLSRLQPRCPTSPAIVHDHVLRRHRLPFNLRPVSRAYPAAATPPGFLSSVLLHRCIIRHPTDLCITRPPIPLHHPSSHTVASSASSASSRLNLASVGNPWHSASSSHRPWLSPSCRQAAAKSFRAIAVSASSAAARPSGSVAGSRSRWAAWRAPAQPTPCCPPLTHVPGVPFAHSGAPGLPPRPRT